MRILVALLCILTTLFSCVRTDESPVALDKDQLVLRLAESESMDHPLAIASKYFADRVNERSEGRIKIKVYYDSELGSMDQVIDQMQFGGIAMGRVDLQHLSLRLPSLVTRMREKIFLPADDLISWIYSNQQALSFDCLTEKLVPLTAFHPDYRCIYSDNPGTVGKEDYSNLRVGCADGVLQKVGLEKLGVGEVTVTDENTYSSLSNGYVDAIEMGFMDFCYSADYDFIKEVLVTDYASYPSFLMISSNTVSSISKNDMAMIYDAAREASEYAKALLNEYDRTWIEKIDSEKILINRGIEL